MQMKITDVFSYGSDTLTTQTQWHIQASIDGQPIDIFYLDAGNNAEYAEDFGVSAPTAALKAAVEAWYERGDDLTRLEAGDVVSLTQEPQARPTPPSATKRLAGPRT